MRLYYIIVYYNILGPRERGPRGPGRPHQRRGVIINCVMCMIMCIMINGSSSSSSSAMIVSVSVSVIVSCTWMFAINSITSSSNIIVSRLIVLLMIIVLLLLSLVV